MTSQPQLFSGRASSLNVNQNSVIHGQSAERTGFEPQFTQTRATNSGILMIDSCKRERADDNAGNFTIDSIGSALPIMRLTGLNAYFNYDIPNINSGNNIYKFAIGGVDRTATINIGYYTAASFAPILKAAMDAAVPVAPAIAPFTVTYDAAKNEYEISNVQDWFSDGGSFVENGKHLINAPVQDIGDQAAIHRFGKVFMQWTRYLLISSNSLTRTQKCPGVTSDRRGGNIIGIIYLTGDEQLQPAVLDKALDNFNINFTYNQFARTDVYIEDEYGRDISSLLTGPQSRSNLDIILTLRYEI